MTKIKVVKVDSELGVILPEEALAALKVAEGDTVYLVEDLGGGFTLTADQKTARQLESLRAVVDRHRGALSKLSDS